MNWKLESVNEKRARLQKMFEGQYAENGGSPIPLYDFDNPCRLTGKRLRHHVRFTVMQLLTVGLTLDTFIEVAKDPKTWYPNDEYPAPDTQIEQDTNPTDN